MGEQPHGGAVRTHLSIKFAVVMVQLIAPQNNSIVTSDLITLMTDHHNKYNNEKV